MKRRLIPNYVLLEAGRSTIRRITPNNRENAAVIARRLRRTAREFNLNPTAQPRSGVKAKVRVFYMGEGANAE